MPSDESLLFDGHPSHAKDLGYHLLCILFAPLVVPVLMMAWRALETRCTRYELTSERLRITSGVLSKRMEELELYRVKDTTVDQPFVLRLFGLANLVVRSSDRSNPLVVLAAIPDAFSLRENLRGCVEKMRASRDVREVDFS